MTYQVRKAQFADLTKIEEIYAYARQFMAETGNPHQWGNNTPSHEQLVADIDQQLLHVLEDAQGIHGSFYFYIGPDPTYCVIEQGSWQSDTPYGTIHRIAGDGSGGVLAAAVSYAASQIGHIRIDTHQDNIVMQKALSKQGFEKRGIIYIEDGTPRIAYDKIIKNAACAAAAFSLCS